MTKLNDLNPCSEAKEWVEQFNTFQEAWQSCDRVDWMIWLLDKLKLPIDQLAKQFAYHVLHIYEEQYPNDKRLRTALENPTKENIIAAQAAEQDAQDAAWAAAPAAEQDAARAAARAAEAAARAAEAAAHAAADGAWATLAAIRAAEAAEAAAVWVSAWVTERQWQCDQIRIMYPVLDVEL